MQPIQGAVETLENVLRHKYSIDFYQREYGWQERQVGELIDDLTGKFLDFYQSNHARHDVENYGHYFLGSVVVSRRDSQRYIVDGQQRLTTLTLLLIFLQHLQGSRSDAVDVSPLIYSQKYGRKSFNLDIDERTEALQSLLDGRPSVDNARNESARNIVVRYENIGEYFPEEITAHALPFFVDWLLAHVHLVVIEASNDEYAYTIFETMNDRGLSLSLPDMLKGYVLSRVANDNDQRAVNDVWKSQMQSLKDVSGDADADADFFKDWFRARYAQTMRQGQKGSENKDYERIGAEFHRWVRDNLETMGLRSDADFVPLITRDLLFYAQVSVKLHKATQRVVNGWESVYFNAERKLTLQRQVILAALSPEDSAEVVRRKVKLVADFLDIWMARRVWNGRTIAHSSIRYTIFTITKELRHRSLEDQAVYLQDLLDQQEEAFAHHTELRLHGSNYHQIRHILARLTYWVDSESGLVCHFEDLVAAGRARPFEIEHIWANHYAPFEDEFAHPNDFDAARNKLGGLLLLQRGLNQSLGDADYDKKREAYATKGENLLARSLHSSAYANNPGFLKLAQRTGLPFRAYEHFDTDAQAERQELYIRIAEWVWNPSRLSLDGDTAPVPVPLGPPLPSATKRTTSAEVLEKRLQFSTLLLEHARQFTELHSGIGPTQKDTLTTRQRTCKWNYVFLVQSARVECYLGVYDAEKNKALFDILAADKAAIEAAFGAPLEWHRADDQRASKITYTIDSDLLAPETWTDTANALVAHMVRLHEVLAPRLSAES